MTIQVTNLDINLTETDLQRIFTPYGEIRAIAIDRDQWTNRSRGKAMIDMPVAKEAVQAIAQLNGFLLGRKKIVVAGTGATDEPEPGTLRF